MTVAVGMTEIVTIMVVVMTLMMLMVQGGASCFEHLFSFGPPVLGTCIWYLCPHLGQKPRILSTLFLSYMPSDSQQVFISSTFRTHLCVSLLPNSFATTVGHTASLFCLSYCQTFSLDSLIPFSPLMIQSHSRQSDLVKLCIFPTPEPSSWFRFTLTVKSKTLWPVGSQMPILLASSPTLCQLLILHSYHPSSWCLRAPGAAALAPPCKV